MKSVARAYRFPRPDWTYLLVLAGWFACTPAQSAEPVAAPPAPPPTAAVDHVYVFCINGFDPLGIGDMCGLSTHIRGQGFAHVEYGQMYNTRSFCQQIKDIKQTDPTARIAIIGYSFGGNRACSLAHWLNDAGIPVDLLIYIAADAVPNKPHAVPPNCRQVVNIAGQPLLVFGGNMVVGKKLDGAENLEVDRRHYGLPTDTGTLDKVCAALQALTVAPVPGH
jgi:hypothetical protein